MNPAATLQTRPVDSDSIDRRPVTVDEQIRSIRERLDRMDRERDLARGEMLAQLDRLEAHAERNDQRATQLELWRARVDGAQSMLRWWPSVVSAIATALVVYYATGGPV